MAVRKERLYNIFNGIKYRVKHNNVPIEKEWLNNYQEFKNWSTANSYTENTRLYLSDTRLGYIKTNCTWATTRTVICKTQQKYICTEKFCNTLVSKPDVRCRHCAGIKRGIHPDMDKTQYRRNWSLQKKYNITLDNFNILFKQQKQQCAICNKHMKLPTKTQGQDLDVVAIDHCHTTQNIRGLLCNACNKGIGLFNDNITVLQNAINYLKDTNETTSNSSKST